VPPYRQGLAVKYESCMVPLLRVQGGTIRVESGKLAQRFFVFTREAGKVTELS
jgi:hypothetical protein